jgi:hypothetical protein
LFSFVCRMESTQLYSKRQNIIVVGIIAFINALFILKYLARYIHHAEIYTLAYIILLGLGYLVWEKKKVHISNTFLLLLAGVFTLAFITTLQLIPAEKLNVDRWSVIYSFWETAFQGKYPYSAQSHMGNFPGPLPVYFILALPFYAIKEIGYMPLIASICFILYVLKKGKTESSGYSFPVLILLTSPCIYWEIIARSTLFFFSFLWLIYAEWFLNKGLSDKKNVAIAGLIGGLLLSTRFIYAMLLALWAIYSLRSAKSIARIVVWGAITIIVFSATILPFWLIFPTEFAQFNPFKTESSSFVPFAYNFIFMGIAVLCSFLCKNNQSTLFFSAITMFLVILLYFGYHSSRDGWDNTLTNSYADISYFILPFPFLLASLRFELRRP